MNRLVPISSLLPKQITIDLPEHPQEYWENYFPELKLQNLPPEFYSRSVQLRLLSAKQDRMICEHCPGIDKCPKDGDAKGHLYSFRIEENQLFEQIRTCKPYEEKENSVRESKLRQFAGLTEGHRKLTFDNFPDEQKKLNKELCIAAWEFANQYQLNQPRKGFYIYGSYGTAKTHLACAILNKMVTRGMRVLYVQAERTFAALADLYFREDRDGLPTRTEILDKYISADVLVIDELGHENITDSSIWTLYSILNGREPEQKPVIITSNFKITDLADLYFTKSRGETRKRAEALLSRLLFLTHSYEMKGEDYRSREYLSSDPEAE